MVLGSLERAAHNVLAGDGRGLPPAPRPRRGRRQAGAAAARVGGPEIAGTRTPEAARFLRDFIEHCLRGTNHATGKVGAPLDFLAKGSPRIVLGHVQMGIATQLQDVDRGFEVVAGFPELKGRPIVIDESDPDSCAACPATVFPQNAYRNGWLYASSTAAAYARTLDLAEKHAVSLEGSPTWAFEFEDQPYFTGFRVLATGGSICRS
jgi:xylan 1,4-beta-xylosidase